jgi:hypothetical protein
MTSRKDAGSSMPEYAGEESSGAVEGECVAASEICFLIGRPRSGTTVFRTMLDSHPLIFSIGEIFNESNPRSYFHFLQKRQASDPNALLPSRALDNFQAYVRWCRARSLKKRPKSRIVILDVKYDQAHLLCVPWWGITFLPRLFSLIRQQNWRLIDIHRQNSLAMFVSNEVAIETGIYHSSALTNGERQRAKVHIDPEALMRQVAATAQAYRRVEEFFRGYESYCKVTYEEMFEGADGEQFSPVLLGRLAAFFNIGNAFNPVPGLTKILERDPFAYIENADEVREIVNRNNIRPPS